MKRISPVQRGLSLLEVILALAILGGSLAVIGELVRLGLTAAESSRNLTNAQLLCESKLAEIAAGIDLPDPISQAPLDPDGNWLYTIESERSEQQPSLLAVRIALRPSTAAATSPPVFTLVRWMVDPAVASEARALQDTQEEAEGTRLEEAKTAQSNSASDTANTNPASTNPAALEGLNGLQPGMLPPGMQGLLPGRLGGGPAMGGNGRGGNGRGDANEKGLGGGRGRNGSGNGNPRQPGGPNPGGPNSGGPNNGGPRPPGNGQLPPNFQLPPNMPQLPGIPGGGGGGGGRGR